MRTILLVTCAGLLLFGCSGRSGDIEALIRSEPSLTRLQRQLDWTLEAAEAGPELQGEQQAWLEGLQRCLDAEDPARCVAIAHTERLTDLQTRFDLTPRSVALYQAASDGFGFRALGNEPGWNLLVSEERCIWETDYGQVRRDITAVTYEQDGSDHRYRAILDGDVWEARLFREPCADDMSGESFPWRATVSWRGQKLRGCAEPTGR